MERMPARAASNAPNANRLTTTMTPKSMLINVEIILPIEMRRGQPARAIHAIK